MTDCISTWLQSITFPCQYCQSEFATLNKLPQHIIKSHPGYVCLFCGKRFSSKEYLYQHTQQHCYFYFDCDMCPETLKRATALLCHQELKHGYLALSSYSTQTLMARHKFKNKRVYPFKPWDLDVPNAIGYGGDHRPGELYDNIKKTYLENMGDIMTHSHQDLNDFSTKTYNIHLLERDKALNEQVQNEHSLRSASAR